MIIKILYYKKVNFTTYAALLLLILVSFNWVACADIPNRSVALTTSMPSATGVTYDLNFDVSSGYDLGSIALEFCQENPLMGQPCTTPSGFDASATQLTSQSGETGFSINPNSTINRIVIGRVPSMTSDETLNYSFSSITNPNTVGEFYARLYLYSSSDGTGTVDYFGGLALSINGAIGVSTEVPPYLLFCAAVTISGYDCSTGINYYIDFGYLSMAGTKAATSQFVLATNADNGLNVYIIGNTLTAGNNIINPLTTHHPSLIDIAQFGLNLRLNTIPNIGQDPVGLGSFTVNSDYNIPNEFQFVNGDTVVSANAPVDYEKFTSSYVVNIDHTNPPGIYSTTVVYICLANF